ncbi:DUF2478 domain-containing protein [Pelomonas sp. CA6]|uniref:DUF2478 domain-containing protein n=1 Tax=Pelomonas sp. CA6 TaxID=2907999 RepID=UPI001F4C3C39|nr:DUF2478 domain-containing protein [Pelomonas sp. CA6]MCH7344266.1 DUF2478 domain-containing protein [Pelomonas sp. CA6]
MMPNPEPPIRAGLAAPASAEPALPVAAILDNGGEDVDALLARFACQQRRAGRRVHGLVMTRAEGSAGCAGDMVLVDVATFDEYLVSQPLGQGSGACRADPQGFARASMVLRRALDEAPELVVCNRFGGLEAEGGGFAAELLALMAAGVPLLTAVASRHLAAWQHFSGGAALLPARAEIVGDWLARTLPAHAHD